MWKLRALLLLPILLIACRPINGNLPAATAVPDYDTGAVPADSPRLATDAPPLATTLPPTWTPRPVEDSQPLPQTSNTVTDAGLTVAEETAVPAYDDGPSTTYIVKRGDTLAEICIEYSAPITDVARINNISNWDHIEIGQALIIPAKE